jgi:hypothetical protein
MAKKLKLMVRGVAERYIKCEPQCNDCSNAFSPEYCVCPVYVERYCHRKGTPLLIGIEEIKNGVADGIYLY